MKVNMRQCFGIQTRQLEMFSLNRKTMINILSYDRVFDGKGLSSFKGSSLSLKENEF